MGWDTYLSVNQRMQSWRKHAPSHARLLFTTLTSLFGVGTVAGIAITVLLARSFQSSFR